MKDVLAELALKVSPYNPAMSSLTLRGDEGGFKGRDKDRTHRNAGRTKILKTNNVTIYRYGP